MNTKLTPVQFEVIRHLAQSPKEHDLEFVRYEANVNRVTIGSKMLIASTRVVSGLVDKGLIIQSGTHLPAMRLTDSGLQYCIEKGLIEPAPVPTSQPDADIIATQAIEDVLAEDELERSEAQNPQSLWMTTVVASDINAFFQRVIDVVNENTPGMSVQAAIIAQPTEARYSTEWEFSTAKVPDFSRPIHATPEQLQHILALQFNMHIEQSWMQAFYAQHARFVSNRLDATYTQALAMITELEALHASIEAMDTKLAYDAFNMSMELGRLLGHERGQLENARLALQVSGGRTRDYTQMTANETHAWFMAAERVAREIACFVAE